MSDDFNKKVNAIAKINDLIYANNFYNKWIDPDTGDPCCQFYNDGVAYADKEITGYDEMRNERTRNEKLKHFETQKQLASNYAPKSDKRYGEIISIIEKTWGASGGKRRRRRKSRKTRRKRRKSRKTKRKRRKSRKTKKRRRRRKSRK